MSTFVSPDTDRTGSSLRNRRLGKRGGQEVPSRLQGGSRRSVPYLALGALLVIACATGFAVLVSQLDERTQVLALARPVTIGQVLTPADLQEVSIAAEPQVATVPSSQAGGVVGSTMAVSLPAGSLLTPATLGDALVPGTSEAFVALALAPGQFPPEVSPGARVLLVVVSDSPADGTAPAERPPGWVATVIGVHQTATDATTVMSVQLGEDDAHELAAAAGQVSVVMVSTGGR